MRYLLSSRRALIIAALVVVALTIGALLFFGKTASQTGYSDDSPTYSRAYWMQELKEKSAAAAYKEFIQKNAAAPPGRQHFAAHVMGSLLAETQGVAGISICDPSFAFGCYHGFFGTIIAEGGASLIPQLDAACVAAYGPLGTGCQHGIGHGILEYVGYAKVSEALDLCKGTTQLVPLLGCTSGVFMEYDFPLAGPSDALAPSTRPLDPEQPYAPCPGVAKEYQDSCYFELGQWLRITQGPDYAKLDSLCGALAGGARTHCYLGVGSVIAPIEGYAVAQAKTRCDAFEPGDARTCRAGVWWSFYQVPEQRAQADAACASADAAEESACRTLGDLTRGLEAN